MARSTVATSTLASAGRSAFVRLTWRSTRGSLKTLRLADRQEGPGRTASCSLAKIDHVIRREVDDQDREVVAEHVDHELDRQRRLRVTLGLDQLGERRLECNYKWLQLWDRISLHICLFGFDSGYEAEYPSVQARVDGGEKLPLRIRLDHGGICLLDPYPLEVEPYRARIPCLRAPLAELDSLERRWRATGWDAMEVTFRSA